MSQSQKLELRQGQSLVMTAQLQQSIKLLQMSSIELVEYIDQELEKNPLLTLDDADESEPSSEQADMEAKEAAPAESPADAENFDATEWESTGEEGQGALSADYNYSSGRGGEENDFLEQIGNKEKSLREHLLDQLYVDIEDPIQRMIGLHIIDMVNDNGYIGEEFDQLSARIDCDPQEVENVLRLLQQFDPVGVCARSLSECLTLQLKEKNRFDPAMERLVGNLDRLAKNEHEAVRKLCGVDSEDFTEMLRELRALNPKPGANFSADVMQQVEPDIFLRKLPSGGWQVELNPGTLPRVMVNQRYYAQLSKNAHSNKQDKRYIADQLATANWLVKALQQRAETILKVATEIVAQQDGFFRGGIRYLRPLTLKDVAQAVQLHESTVSRVTSNKYINTSTGTYELKYFFTSSLQNSSGGEDYSSKTVQHLIKELVDGESPKAILSDDTIADRLKERGISVARRTITKYREAMNIPSSVERRRQKNRL